MRELILDITVSIDGLLPDSDKGVLLPGTGSPELTAWSLEKVLWNASLHIMGSQTFRGMAAYLPIAGIEIAPPLNQIPKAVFTKNPQAMKADIAAARLARPKELPRTVQPGAESWDQAYIASGDLVEEITKLKMQDGKPILAHGGNSFARSLVASGLVDCFILNTSPAVLGKGLPLFSTLPQPLQLEPYILKSFPHGLIVHGYRRPLASPG